MPFLMVRGDIAKMQTDAVVIPAAGAGQPHKIRLALCRAIMRKSFGSSAPSIIYVIVPAWTDDRNKREQELSRMLLLGIIVVLLGGYLVYALAHPERF